VIHGISHMHISVRNLLTWFVMHNPSEQARIVALRDDFYAGDSEDDYSYQIDPGDDPSVTAEDRALARAARMETRAERDEARAEITAEYEAGDRIEREVWAPFLADRRVLEAERETHWQRADALDAEWDGVVSHGADDSSEERLSAVKADLVSRS